MLEIKASLSSILQVNYFFTKAMEKKLGKGSFNSITGLLLFFLAMSDCEVTGATRIAISQGGALVQETAADDAMSGNSTGELPFSYGYAYKRGESNLMTAERVQ